MDARALGRPVALVAGTALALALVTGCGDDDGGAGSEAPPSASQEAGGSPSPTGSDAPSELVVFLTEQFESDDANGDGALDADEIAASIQGDFEDSDLDGDGSLTLADVQADLDDADGGTADQPLSYYLPYDRDDDDAITREEYVLTVMEDVMTPMDTDTDGRVTLDEAIAWHEQAASPEAGS